MDRRRFLQLLGVAPIAFNPHRVYFDMGRRLWRVAPDGLIYHPAPIVSVLDQLNAVTQRYIDHQLGQSVFGPAEFLRDLRDWQDKPLAERVTCPQLSTVNPLPPWQH